MPQIMNLFPLGKASLFRTSPDLSQQVPPLSPVHAKWLQSASVNNRSHCKGWSEENKDKLHIQYNGTNGFKIKGSSETLNSNQIKSNQIYISPADTLSYLGFMQHAIIYCTNKILMNYGDL